MLLSGLYERDNEGVNGMELEEAINIMCGMYIRHENKPLRSSYMKAIIALEKERPLKPYREEWVGIDGVPYDLCPCCGHCVFSIGRKISYCPRCGQALLW